MSRNDGILNDADCSKALHNYVKTKDAKLVSFSIEPLSSVEGLIGEHFKVKIQYENKGAKHNRQFFLKVLNGSLKVMFDISMSLDAYGKEEFLYQFLINEFNTNAIDTSYAPNFYMCRPYLLLLEDVSLRGYKTAPKKEMLNVEHCKIALKSLAKFHTSAIIYEEIKSKERGSRYSLFEEYPKKFEDKLFSETENAASKWFKCTLEGILQIITLLPANEIDADVFTARLLDAIGTFGGLVKASKKYRNTIIHGDLWSNNIMFRYEDEAPVDAVIIDYQLLQYGTPAVDVVQMIVTNVRRHVRSDCYNELLMCYYDHFRECLNGRGINPGDILTLEDYLISCDDVRIMSKMLATADHSITFLMDEAVGEALASEDTLERFLFNDRSKEITTSYNNNELYRQILQEDLIEVRDLLFAKI